MFQTELIKYFQSFATDGLTGFLVLVSQLGYSSFYIPVLIFITLGLDFRKGFLLTQMMIWVGLSTDLLKNLIGLPRPADVDSGVMLLQEKIPNPTPFTDMGGHGFWELPAREAIELFRAQPDWSYGLPSGHVSGTTTFWGGLSILFRWKPLEVALLVMCLLMPLSRIYLGRHFLADVLGGFMLGSAVVALAFFLFMRPVTRGRFLTRVRLVPALSFRFALVPAFLLGVPLVLLTLGRLVEPEHAGRLFGLNAAFLLLATAGLPDDVGTWFKRLLRVAVAFALYLIATWSIGLLLEAAALDQKNLWIEFVAAAIPAFVVMWGGVRAGLALRLYSWRSRAELADS